MNPEVPEPASPFYPVTCHPAAVSRRQLLVGGGALLAVGALGRSVARAGDEGTSLIRQFASSPDDPWAVCHGVRAMGSDFRVKGGERAVDWLLENHLASVPANGKSALAFPEPVEVHPNMFLKTMLEAGVRLDYEFTHQGRRRMLGEVVEGARALFRPSLVMNDPNMLPWSIIAFARTSSAFHGRWTNAWGETVDLDAVVGRALQLMEEASLPLMQAMRADRPESAKAPVHGFTCGGTHLLYALLTAAHAGYAGADGLPRVRQQTDLMVWRLSADLGLIDRFYRDRAVQPGAYWYEIDAKVKLLGHGQECLALGTHRSVVKLTAGQQGQWRRAVTTLNRMIDDIEAHNLVEARDIDRDLFRQLVGDTCHARHGLTMT